MTTEAHLLPIEQLNQQTEEAFVGALKPLFEAADPLAQALFAARPYTSYAALLNRAEEAIGGMDEADKITVINAHPRIGANPADVRALSSISYREQGYDREGAMDPAELEQVYRDLGETNRQYEEQFGFRFVEFVNKRPKAVILGVLRQRLHNPREQEMTTALAAMLLIARDRLKTMQQG